MSMANSDLNRLDTCAAAYVEARQELQFEQERLADFRKLCDASNRPKHFRFGDIDIDLDVPVLTAMKLQIQRNIDIAQAAHDAALKALVAAAGAV
jgi:hypothetical protein